MSTALSTGEPGASESAAERSHKKSLPPPETEGGEPGVSESAATKRRTGKT